jgi:hypothetical protein
MIHAFFEDGHFVAEILGGGGEEAQKLSSGTGEEGVNRAVAQGNLPGGGVRERRLGGKTRSVFQGPGQGCLDFKSRVWDFHGGDSSVARGMYFGYCQEHSKMEAEILEVQIFNYATRPLRHRAAKNTRSTQKIMKKKAR